jgi:hypothetical protein
MSGDLDTPGGAHVIGLAVSVRQPLSRRVLWRFGTARWFFPAVSLAGAPRTPKHLRDGPVACQNRQCTYWCVFFDILFPPKERQFWWNLVFIEGLCLSKIVVFLVVSDPNTLLKNLAPISFLVFICSAINLKKYY